MPYYDSSYRRRRGAAAWPPEPYGRDFGARPGPFSGWYPGGFWADAPMYGWSGLEGGWPWPPYAPVGVGRYARDYPPRRPPGESPTYGRGGDLAARRWAERYGYEIEYSIRPRERRPPRFRR